MVIVTIDGLVSHSKKGERCAHSTQIGYWCRTKGERKGIVGTLKKKLPNYLMLLFLTYMVLAALNSISLKNIWLNIVDIVGGYSICVSVIYKKKQ